MCHCYKSLSESTVHAIWECVAAQDVWAGRGGGRIFCLRGPNFVTNILVSSQDKPSHSDINAHIQI